MKTLHGEKKTRTFFVQLQPSGQWDIWTYSESQINGLNEETLFFRAIEPIENFDSIKYRHLLDLKKEKKKRNLNFFFKKNKSREEVPS